MYERFTDRARKALQLANQEAQRCNHDYIGTEHILLGLIKFGTGVAANVLKNLDVDLRKVRREVEMIVQSGPDRVIPGRLPQTPRAKRVIAFAIEEARGLGHNYVGTEHLLMGLLREHEGVAAEILMNLGLSLETVRAEVLNLLGRPTVPPPPPPPRWARTVGHQVRGWATHPAWVIGATLVGGLIGGLACGDFDPDWGPLVGYLVGGGGAGGLVHWLTTPSQQ